ncbi:MAG TPA: hypothetical protein PLK30_23735 [Blastocatellia bacterium]|nr:hypothetical protein [Blastocatellia bacterium]
MHVKISRQTKSRKPFGERTPAWGKADIMFYAPDELGLNQKYPEKGMSLNSYGSVKVGRLPTLS